MMFNNIEIRINGIKIEGIKEVSFKPSIEKLKLELKEAEKNEDYKLCIYLKKQIDDYNK